MEFSFLHAADLHLGSPFLGLSSADEDLAKRIASASRDAFEDLVSQAIDRLVSFLIISGDVYDGDWKDTTIGHFFNRQMGRLERAGIPVFTVKGNHDAESVITTAVTLPGTVRAFSARRVETFRLLELKVALHGQSFSQRSITENLVLHYPKPDDGWFNIGVLHTSCDGRPGHATYAPCSVQDLLSCSYQYWALGHVLNYEELSTDPPIIFPGNLQGRHIRECGPKGAVLVQVLDGEVAAYSRIFVDRVRWAVISADLTGVDSESEAFGKIREAIQRTVNEAAGIPLVFRMILSGETNMHRGFRSEPERIADEVLAAANHCTDSIWLESLKDLTSPPSNAVLDQDGLLASIDLSSMLSTLKGSPEVVREAREAMDALRGKFPPIGETETIFSDTAIRQLLDEARESLIASGIVPQARNA